MASQSHSLRTSVLMFLLFSMILNCQVTVTDGFTPCFNTKTISPSRVVGVGVGVGVEVGVGRASPASLTLKMAASDSEEKEEFMKFARQSRSAGSNDRVVELVRPLGIVLADDGQGNVYVQTVAPRGNAARTGMVKEGDVVTMCSATFGNEMWSTRGVGLTRVLAAIRVRAGSTVKLALESPGEGKRKAALTAKQVKQANEARMAAQAKKDRLLSELEKDEKKLKGNKFFGLF